VLLQGDLAFAKGLLFVCRSAFRCTGWGLASRPITLNGCWKWDRLAAVDGAAAIRDNEGPVAVMIFGLNVFA